jgi:hypothetical protein
MVVVMIICNDDDVRCQTGVTPLFSRDDDNDIVNSNDNYI